MPLPTQPLFPFPYETWAARTSGRECAVVEYEPEADIVGYMYYDDQEKVLEETATAFMRGHVFVRSP